MDSTRLYWWVTGWDFNRPVIAKVGVGAHFKTGPYARGSFDGVFHRAEHFEGIPFVFVGPIGCPHSLLGEEPSDQMNDKTLETVNLLPGKSRLPSERTALPATVAGYGLYSPTGRLLQFFHGDQRRDATMALAVWRPHTVDPQRFERPWLPVTGCFRWWSKTSPSTLP